MRPAPILRQVATAAASRAQPRVQAKLPLPTVFPANTKKRLLPSKTPYLPSPVNCPTTFAPILGLPTEVGTGWNATGKYILKQAWAYLMFYKEGVQLTRRNMKVRKDLKKELLKSLKNVNIPGSQMITMTRSEFQLMIRTKRDMRKLPCMFFRNKTDSSVRHHIIDCGRADADYCVVFRKLISSCYVCHSVVS
jgi:hypothetical protein